MAIVERCNVVLEIADDDIQRYLNMGYSVTDGHGHVLQRAMPNDVGELRALVVKYEAEIKELKATIKELTEVKEQPEVVDEIKPARRGRPKRVTTE